MILQALHGLYERFSSVPNSPIPKLGYSKQPIHACLILNDDGSLNGLLPLREEDGKVRPVMMEVPGGGKVSGTTPRPNVAWDNTGYLLGRARTDGKRALKTFASSRAFHEQLSKEVDHPALKALCRFMANWDPSFANSLPKWKDIADKNLVVRLSGQMQYLHDAPEIRAWWESHRQMERGIKGQCLVTGEWTTIARVHRTKIKGVKGSRGEYVLTGLDDEAFWSHGREQSYNAPVSAIAAFKYATALNEILGPDSRQKVQIGDATVVFWTEKPEPIESIFGTMLNPPDDPETTTRIHAVLDAVSKGRHSPELGDTETKFYILGLSSNGPRLVVRFWLVSSIGEIEQRVGRFFNELTIERVFASEPKYPGVSRLLIETAARRDAKKIPDTLEDALMRSMLTGTLYPASLLPILLERTRVEQAQKDKRTGRPILNVNYYRAALIKAALIRNYKKEVSMTLNVGCPEPGYLLGRLFAVLEYTQEWALGGPATVNASIRDLYYGSASATPAAVFPVLIRLNQHHLSKLRGEKPGLAVTMDKWNCEIADKLPEKYPPRLNLEQQGMFAQGYYHQRNQLFRTGKQQTREEE